MTTTLTIHFEDETRTFDVENIDITATVNTEADEVDDAGRQLSALEAAFGIELPRFEPEYETVYTHPEEPERPDDFEEE